MTRCSRPAIAGLSILLLTFASTPARAVTRAAACPLNYAFNKTVTRFYSNGVQFYIGSIDFTYGLGDFDVLAYSMGATAGTYSFGSITSATGQFLLVDATIYAGCGEYGNVPPVGTDEFGNIIYDGNGDPHVLEDLGATRREGHTGRSSAVDVQRQGEHHAHAPLATTLVRSGRASYDLM